ncbi:DUF2339 domain-containing protein [Manganibacter manganicus]|uniref:Membrane-like protein n=1 Tax=Manganibacter manganicus TaxID=1873176 RepID=A0A1V8RK98_9HYPH|nr:DUF2339 domain-containing protein [Pseudaminobacter manganicus]OQM73536.1 membrane-like protein [Pseudaminobacter manganicus]
MYEISFIAIIVLFLIVWRQHRRLSHVERELTTLRGIVPAGGKSIETAISTPAEALSGDETAAVKVSQDAGATDDETAFFDGPWNVAAKVKEETAGEAMPEPASRQASPVAKPDIETALGTRWAVWVGGVALALGGLFLVRYSIEAGIFGPGVRLTLAALLGFASIAAGEFVRRTGFKVPVQGAAGAYVPAILTAAGAFVLFGTVYAAHGIYGFIGPASAFLLLGLLGIATIAAALVHGQALAGVGLLGSLATPFLVASQSPSPWTLFGYLAIVLAATAFIARIRDWSFLVIAAFTGTGLWTLLYMADAFEISAPVVAFIDVASLAVLAFIWLGGRGEEQGVSIPLLWSSLASAVLVAISVLILIVDPDIAAGHAIWGALVVAAMVAAALYRRPALPLLYGAGAATVLAYAWMSPLSTISLDFSGSYPEIVGIQTLAAQSSLPFLDFILGLGFLAAGLWAARRLVVKAWGDAASWAGWAAVVPFSILLSDWLTFGNIDHDFFYAVLALILLSALMVGGEWIARAEEPPLAGGPAASFSLGGAGVTGLVMLHMAFGSGLTTVLLGAAAIVPAVATRWRAYPVLGWLSAGAAVAVLGRVAFDPAIVGAAFLSKTPVFNWLLLGYGVPALAFGFSAWQLARTTNGRPRLVMEAAAALFGLLAIAMLVRHAMHGGVIDSGAPTLAEQAIYTLIALGAGAILVALDMRSPSSVLRYGSLIAGVLSVLAIVFQHFIALNPLYTDEATGSIPVFNLLLLAYLLPAIAAGGLALYARGKRPGWYSTMLGAVSALLVFAYATLSVRRLFRGQHLGYWAGFGQWETYSYSALWLVMGVVILALGVRLGSQILRIASAALIAIAVLKVFVFDMSALEGVLRALSFIGLGAVLIGIGLFYQRLLTRAAQEKQAVEVGS